MIRRFSQSRVSICLMSVVFGCACHAKANDVLIPLDLRQVKVGGEIGRRIDATTFNNLHLLDIEKDFLAPIRDKTASGGYIGLGKLIDSAVRLAAYQGDEKTLAIKNHLIEETIKTQEPDGYIGMIAPEARMSGMWDIHEMGYIVYGLTSDYTFFGNKTSLEAARKLADYIIAHWSNLPADWDRQTHIASHVSVTGLERTLLALSNATGDRRYLDFCIHQRALPEWNLGIVIGRREGIEGHIYAYVARCAAQIDLNRLQPNPKLLRTPKRAYQFLTAQDGACVNGAAGQWEIWTADQDGRGALGETCATAYQLRLYDGLLRLEGNARYGDLMERTIYNALFAAQSPDGRKIRYYIPLEGPREYYPTDTYCCPCNYRRIVAELPTMVYYRAGNGVAVNLYTSSKATIPLDGGVELAIRQETDYPTSGDVKIVLDPSKAISLPLQLRIPKWCKQAGIAVNGKPWQGRIVPGEFATLQREWKPGDRVELTFPMDWRLVLGRKRQSGRAAVMRGPMLFCMDPAKNESFENKDAADLGKIVLDPAQLKDSTGDSPRPGAMACRVRACDQGYAIGVDGDLTLTLTEFADPDGKAVYFRLPDLSAAVPDELLSGDCP